LIRESAVIKSPKDIDCNPYSKKWAQIEKWENRKKIKIRTETILPQRTAPAAQSLTTLMVELVSGEIRSHKDSTAVFISSKAITNATQKLKSAAHSGPGLNKRANKKSEIEIRVWVRKLFSFLKANWIPSMAKSNRLLNALFF